MNQTCVQIAGGGGGGGITAVKKLPHWCLLNQSGVYSVPFELFVSGIILFGAWKVLQYSDSTDEKVVAVKPGFGGL